MYSENGDTPQPATVVWERRGSTDSMDAVSSLPEGVERVRVQETGALEVTVASGAYSFVLA